MIDVADGNSVYYYHFDGLGSVVALSDTSANIVERYSYDVFGEPNRTSDVNNPYLFTGRRYDNEAGLYYYRARYYAPEIGRFLQTDPIGYADSLNLYTYVGNNPTNWVDTLGLWPSWFSWSYLTTGRIPSPYGHVTKELRSVVDKYNPSGNELAYREADILARRYYTTMLVFSRDNRGYARCTDYSRAILNANLDRGLNYFYLQHGGIDYPSWHPMDWIFDSHSYFGLFYIDNASDISDLNFDPWFNPDLTEPGSDSSMGWIPHDPGKSQRVKRGKGSKK